MNLTRRGKQNHIFPFEKKILLFLIQFLAMILILRIKCNSVNQVTKIFTDIQSHLKCFLSAYLLK